MNEKIAEVTMDNKELVQKVRDWVSSLCKTGGRSWSLSVPVNFDKDPDMLIEELCKRFTKALSHQVTPTEDANINHRDNIKFTQEMIDGYYESCRILNMSLPELSVFTDTSRDTVKELYAQVNFWESEARRVSQSLLYLAKNVVKKNDSTPSLNPLLEECELRQLFRNKSDCYADTVRVSQETIVEGDVVQAMTEDRFIQVLTELIQFAKEGK